MIKIALASIKDLPIIHQLAHKIWWPTYKDYVSKEQINFMLAKMYAIEALEKQLEEGHIFLILSVNEVENGFASISATEENGLFKLHKLYLHPNQQGKGTGKILISKAEELAKKLGAKAIKLNVNRGNKAYHFYKKMGYQIIEELDIPYFDYVLEDFIMQKSLI
jgi:GNAT superfamily N-acetyltransferase